jgi:NMD protein affecting ribosome stability and mRNA decay
MYLPEAHYCYKCGVYLGSDDGDGVCYDCSDDSEDAAQEIEVEPETADNRQIMPLCQGCGKPRIGRA